MTLENFMTNVIILAVENQLMTKLPEILTMKKIVELDKKSLEHLAGESEDTQLLREELQVDVTKLKNGLELCDNWRRANMSKSIVTG